MATLAPPPADRGVIADAGPRRALDLARDRRLAPLAPLRSGAGLHGGHGPSSRLACERG